MIPPVTARTALVRTTHWDSEKQELVAGCIYTLLNQKWRQHDIATRRLRRCIDQIALLEHWREGPNQARGATIRATGYQGLGIGSKKAQTRNLGLSTTQAHAGR